jgi:hypothetical protein
MRLRTLQNSDVVLPPRGQSPHLERSAWRQDVNGHRVRFIRLRARLEGLQDICEPAESRAHLQLHWRSTCCASPPRASEPHPTRIPDPVAPSTLAVPARCERRGRCFKTNANISDPFLLHLPEEVMESARAALNLRTGMLPGAGWKRRRPCAATVTAAARARPKNCIRYFPIPEVSRSNEARVCRRRRHDQILHATELQQRSAFVQLVILAFSHMRVHMSPSLTHRARAPWRHSFCRVRRAGG